MDYNEKTLFSKDVYKGNIIDVKSLIVLLPNGKEAIRDIIIHPGAAVVIPLNENNEIYMVRQYRKSIEKITLELPAGKLDENEDPKICAIRELKEETGIVANNVKHVINIHSAVGFSNEVLYMYIATELKEEDSCPDENEFISYEKIKIEKLLNMILDGQITDAKSIIGILIASRIIKGEIKI